MPQICVVLATYNGSRYLSQMLDSLVEQTRKADVIIAVDDGSSDSTVEILKEYRQKLPLQIHELGKNCGHRVAFSRGLEFAMQVVSENDFIALSDQDDIWLPQKLEILEREMGDASLVFGDAVVIDGDGNVKADSWRKLASISEKLPVLARIAGTNNVTGCLSMFRADLLDTVLPIPEGVSFHDAWIALVASKRSRVKAVPQPVAKYRLHENNAIGLGHRYSFDETTSRQIAWFSCLSENASRLDLNPEELEFVKKSRKYWSDKDSKILLIGYLPWLIASRKFLFPEPGRRLSKIVFSLLGRSAVHRIFGKNK